MKSIDTLVEDIYNLFNDIENDIDDTVIEEFGDNIKTHLKAALLDNRNEGRSNLRLSAIGRPDRQIWYDVNLNDKSEAITSPTRIKFLYGYILEELLIALSRLAGHTVTDTQKELDIQGVKGHQDCVIDGVLVDCKSTSPRGYEKFDKGDLVSDDPFGYIAQISAYSEANGVDEAAFLAINKQSGEICLAPVHSLEMIDAGSRVSYLKSLVENKSPPNKCYSDVKEGASGNRRLGTSCLYCNHKKECWKDANDGKGLRVYNYARGYRYLTKVVREPDVEEILEW
tara:strand:- start:1282 stop:2133 length:852 start_codon:yes stop_codon:yes gene_type:complete